MAKTKISEFSATPGNNTDIDGINIAEGCAPSGINDAIRELMSQLKDFQAGTAGDSFNGPVGTTTAAAGAFTTLTASSTATLNTLASSGATLTGGSINNMAIGGTTAAAASVTTLTTSSTVTHNGGTANGVAYLNGSKVLTTGSALTFDGTNFNLGSGYFGIAAQKVIGSGNGYAGNTLAASSGTLELWDGSGHINLSNNWGSGAIKFGIGGSEQMRLTSTGLGIGTSSPSQPLHVRKSADGVILLDSSTAGYGTFFAQSGLAEVYLGSLNNYALGIYTNGTKKATFDTSGNLGLGVTPSAWNTAGSTRAFEFQNNQGSGAVAGWFGSVNLLNNAIFSATGGGTMRYVASAEATQYQQVSGSHRWFTAPSGTAGDAISFTQAMTLDASGRLLQGTTSSKAYVSGVVNADWATVFSASGSGTTFDSSTGQVAIDNPDTTANNYSRLAFTTNDGTNRVVSAGIYAQITARSAGNWTTSNLQFFTGTVGGPPAERARIDSSGNLLVGGTAEVGRISSMTGGGFAGSQYRSDSATAAGTGWYHLYATSSSNTVLNIRIYGNGNVENANNSYGGTSDIKLKENIVDATPKLADLMQVKVRNYNFKNAPNHKQIGVIAQELEQVFPGMIEETPDRDAEGNDLGTTTKAVKYSVFVPMLIKAIQEQQAIINDLRARVAQLESN